MVQGLHYYVIFWSEIYRCWFHVTDAIAALDLHIDCFNAIITIMTFIQELI